MKRSNHDHLGKLITYLTAIGAKAAIWIVEDPETRTHQCNFVAE